MRDEVTQAAGKPDNLDLLDRSVDRLSAIHSAVRDLDFQIDDHWVKYISRMHARIRVDGASAIIEDAGSTNGFLVNSVETKQHALVDGDRLEIGDCKLRYLNAAAAS